MPGWRRSCSPTLTATGCCKGVNVTATAALARALSIPVIASGGVGSIADIDALMAANEPNIEGVVVGRALYDGRIDPQRLALAKTQRLRPCAELTALAQPAGDLVQLLQAGVGDPDFPLPLLSPLWII